MESFCVEYPPGKSRMKSCRREFPGGLGDRSGPYRSSTEFCRRVTSDTMTLRNEMDLSERPRTGGFRIRSNRVK